MSFFLGIAGGSGAGKSTVAFGLQDRFPNQIGIVHLDDYHRKRVDLHKVGEMENWEEPYAIKFDELMRDLQALKNGEPIQVRTKSERLNPNYETIGRLDVVIEPKPIILVEGYLALWHPDVRALLDRSVFLEAPESLRFTRRNKFLNEAYAEQVLRPMHDAYVEPTKFSANEIIQIADLTPNDVIDRIISAFSQFFTF